MTRDQPDRVSESAKQDSFLERIEETMRKIMETQSQQQDQIRDLASNQKRERDLQPPEWFLRWKMTN